MKITIYTTTNCQFSKQEKDYLTSKGVAFEDKNLDTNKAFLTEMMTVGNNFAGTHVTKIEKDDGSIVVLKGFTQDEFDVALGFAPENKPEESVPAVETPAPAAEDAKTPAAPSQPVIETTPPIPPQETAPQPMAPTTPPPVADKAPEAPLNDVLSQLEDQMKDANKPQEPAPSAIPTVESPAAPSAPTAPSTPSGSDSAPTIPDFPADAAAQPAK
jgi:glutaredoxin